MNTGATLWWDAELPGIRYIEQTLLPAEYRVANCCTVDELASAIRTLAIRGAPALGVAGGFGVALAAATCREKNFDGFIAAVRREAERLRATRPTAVNLGWGIDRVLSLL